MMTFLSQVLGLAEIHPALAKLLKPSGSERFSTWMGNNLGKPSCQGDGSCRGSCCLWSNKPQIAGAVMGTLSRRRCHLTDKRVNGGSELQ